MLPEELNRKRKEILERARRDYNEACVEYLKSNSTIQVGDTIEDHIGKGVVKEIKYRLPDVTSNHYPDLVFLCDNLTKKGTISKREPTRHIYEINLRN